MSQSVASSWEPHYAARAERMKASEIRELLKLLDQPGIISFAGGIPDPQIFPAGDFAAAYAGALGAPETAGVFLQYSVSEGYAPLTGWIADYMRRQGVAASRDNILVTSGSQQGLDFLGKLLLSPGDTALVARPTYLGALQAFSAYEPRYDTLPGATGNQTPQAYRAAAEAAGGRVKFAYVVPDFANPTGETMTLAERQALLGLAEELDAPILEDAAYRDVRFEGAALPSIQALDAARRGGLDHSRVVYLGSFSKTVAPGLRIGWICAARALISRLVLVKQASDLNVSVINQRVMHEIVDSRYGDLVQTAIGHYSVKRDAMLAALAEFMPRGCSWSRPEGGLFVWVTLPEHLSGATLLQRAVAEANVAFVPGGAFFHDGGGANTIRLSYSLPKLGDIREGVRRLAGVVAASA